jgi:uncharacterized protein (TIGR03382 family)
MTRHALLLGLALLAAPAWAQEKSSVTATVNGNSVVACLHAVGSDGKAVNPCANQWNLWREEDATGKAFRLINCSYDAATSSGCFSDYCLPPGKYTYGHDCGDQLASVEVTQPLGSCQFPTGVPVPTASGSEAPFRSCTTGCGCQGVCAAAPGMALAAVALLRRRRAQPPS